MPVQQPLALPSPQVPQGEPELVVVNLRCVVRTQDDRRVVLAHGMPVASYEVGDGAAEAMAMVNLVETSTATQAEVARAFGCSARQVRRYQRQWEDGGVSGLSRRRGRRPGAVGVVRMRAPAVRLVRTLREQGISNREIARRVGVCEKSIRKILRRMGLRQEGSPRQAQLSLAPSEETPGVTAAPSAVAPTQDSQASRAPDRSGALASAPETCVGAPDRQEDLDEPQPLTFDRDPANRRIDRFLARMGVLDDAAPLFLTEARVPHAGVLLALPALHASGLLAAAREVYGSIGPAFYGLRSTLLVLLFMALLRIRRPEGLKEQVPAEMGRLVGLDRSPEVKTLRRKLERLAKLRRSDRFGMELARRRVEARGETLGFFYVDGHVRVYHGKRKLPKAHVAQARLAMPATTDYWVNDQAGDPLFVVTAEANAGMVKVLPDILAQVKKLVGEREVTVVFDRGGWSPKLFLKLREAGFHILTYRKGKADLIPEKYFKPHRAILDGRPVEYLLHNEVLRLLDDKLRLRQVTRLTDDHQTQVLTTRWDLPSITVAYRMFERWRQENFFKYMRHEFMLDALVDYQVEPDDPDRTVPNPERRRLDKEVRGAREELTRLQDAYGAAALDNPEAKRPTMRGFKIAHGKLGKQVRAQRERLDALMAKRSALPQRVPVSEAIKEPVVKLAAERKHLTDLVKMVAYQVESDLLSALRPHYARADDEGRTLVQTILASSADIEVADDELRVAVAPLSSPHRTRALTALCDDLNRTPLVFPGTSLRVRYAVAGGGAAG
jgi:transposase